MSDMYSRNSCTASRTVNFIVEDSAGLSIKFTARDFESTIPIPSSSSSPHVGEHERKRFINVFYFKKILKLAKTDMDKGQAG